MVTLPMRRDPAPLAVRIPAARAHAPAGPEPDAAPDPIDGESTLRDRIGAAVDDALAEALAKASTPADQALARQQQAFDQLMARRAEQQREANAIRDMGLEQLKHDDEVMRKWIAMI
jgi:hypothetical protein